MTAGGQLSKYKIVGELGAGGFATVFKAVDTVLHRDVALKLLHPQLLTDPAFVTRFENDARATAQLDHPRIAAVYDLGHHDGRMFMAVQLLSGGSLADRIKQRGQLPFAEAVRVVGDIAQALDYAHAAGFVHRDVKPGNILFNARGDAYLTDFGLVKAAESSVIARTTIGGLIGTPPYMAPEIWEGQTDGPAADIYALGCVLYEMLSGELLFSGATPPAVMRAHFQAHRYPERWPEDTPPAIEAVLERALARDPAQRYPTAGALWQALADLKRQAPVARSAVSPQAPKPISVPASQDTNRSQDAQAAVPSSLQSTRSFTAEPEQLAVPDSAPGAPSARAEVEQPAAPVAQPTDLSVVGMALFALAIALDIAGGEIVKLLQLPFSQDTIGAVLIGALFGPWIGAIAGLLGHAIWTLLGYEQYALVFSPVGGVVGLLAGFAGRLGVFQRPSPRWLSALAGAVFVFSLALFVAMFVNSTSGDNGRPALPDAGHLVTQGGLAPLVALVLGLLIGYFVLRNAGYVVVAGLLTGVATTFVVAGIWVSQFGGDAAVIARSLLFGQNSIVEPFDKLLSFMIVYFVIRLLPRRVLQRFPNTRRHE